MSVKIVQKQQSKQCIHIQPNNEKIFLHEKQHLLPTSSCIFAAIKPFPTTEWDDVSVTIRLYVSYFALMIFIFSFIYSIFRFEPTNYLKPFLSLILVSFQSLTVSKGLMEFLKISFVYK